MPFHRSIRKITAGCLLLALVALNTSPAARADDDGWAASDAALALSTTATSVAISPLHGCAVMSTGTVYCWGQNSSGQLGDGTLITSPKPVRVTGVTTATAVTVGNAHSCALMRDGSAQCWGDNAYGQLGPAGVGARVLTPTVAFGPGAVQIEAGFGFTCARSSAGGAWCLGDNSAGQLGAAVGASSSVPVQVTGLAEGVLKIDAGYRFVCALLKDGSVQCWGDNTYGQIGNVSTLPATVPQLASVAGMGNLDVSAGFYHACVVGADHVARCWGLNSAGALGDAAVTQNPVTTTVVAVKGLTNTVASIVAGFANTCAVTLSAAAWCWGDNASYQLTDVISSVTPLRLIQLTNLPGAVNTLVLAATHACALNTSGRVYCWGRNSAGSLGSGKLETVNAPAEPVSAPNDSRAVAVGILHACRLRTNSAVECWGSNGVGQLGLFSDARTRYTPVPVPNVGAVLKLRSGRTHVCAQSSAALQCWGSNGVGELGAVMQSTGLVTVPLPSAAITDFDLGLYTSCAVISNTVNCWGNGAQGQLGNGALLSSNTPQQTGLISATAVAAGESHACAIAGGLVKCWGQGELGAGAVISSAVPIDVSGLVSGVTAIDIGSNHTCAARGADGVFCWGLNQYGQSGVDIGLKPTVQLPITVTGMLAVPVKKLALGTFHSCALLMDGDVRCWGGNSYGQLGAGVPITRISVYTATQVVLNRPALDLSASYLTTCATLDDGNVRCWGYGGEGQLGNGSGGNTAPVAVTQLNTFGIAMPLALSATGVEQEPNGNISVANPLGPGAIVRGRIGSVNAATQDADEYDLFTVTLPTTGTLSLALSLDSAVNGYFQLQIRETNLAQTEIGTTSVQVPVMRSERLPPGRYSITLFLRKDRPQPAVDYPYSLSVRTP
jgi:alpha-tubulin suppressor-like RCC1 family protein